MKERLTSENGRLLLGGKDFFLVSGDLHYFRVHPADWGKRLALMKDFGLTAVQTYCPWNLHEPKRGEFDFEGLLDLGRFIDEAAEQGLKVLLRPAPFICSECAFGGMPAWLLGPRELALRSLDPRFIEPLEEYYRKLAEIIVPRLSTNGGPVIAVALENEYGGISHDLPYLEKLAEILKNVGVDVPFYTTDGNVPSWIRNGTTAECIMEGQNYRAKPGDAAIAKKYHDELHPDSPFFVGELWAGRAIYWDEPFSFRDPRETAEAFREALELGAYVNFYMFAGGTNFGSFSGAVVGKSYTPRPDAPARYIAHTTSYDEDSLISECGLPTEKYYLCRDVLDKFLGKPVRERKPYPYQAQAIGEVKFTEEAPLFENLDALTSLKRDSVRQLTMEEMGEDTDFLLYSTRVTSFGMRLDSRFLLRDVRDRATLYADGEYIGTVLRDRGDEVAYPLPKEGCDLQILVENIARINTGMDLDFERKGILKDVRYANTRLVGWENRALDLKNIKNLHYEPIKTVPDENIPVFLRASFKAEPGVDSYLLTEGFTRGHVWINGFDIGRFWDVGPQRTLYIPGALLKEENIIEILDINPTGKKSIKFADKMIFEEETV